MFRVSSIFDTGRLVIYRPKITRLNTNSTTCGGSTSSGLQTVNYKAKLTGSLRETQQLCCPYGIRVFQSYITFDTGRLVVYRLKITRLNTSSTTRGGSATSGLQTVNYNVKLTRFAS